MRGPRAWAEVALAAAAAAVPAAAASEAAAARDAPVEAWRREQQRVSQEARGRFLGSGKAKQAIQASLGEGSWGAEKAKQAVQASHGCLAPGAQDRPHQSESSRWQPRPRLQMRWPASGACLQTQECGGKGAAGAGERDVGDVRAIRTLPAHILTAVAQQQALQGQQAPPAPWTASAAPAARSRAARTAV